MSLQFYNGRLESTVFYPEDLVAYVRALEGQGIHFRPRYLKEQVPPSTPEARLAPRTRVWIYFLSGLLTGWAGILVFAQGSGGDPTSSVGLELEVIAAVVIGGASLAGGQGGVLGTLLGVLILAILENGVNLFGVAVEVKYILIGAIVVVNTALSQWQRKQSD